MPRRLLDDPGGGEMGDEFALAIRGDGILARRLVDIRREGEQRIVVRGRLGGGGDVAGGLARCGAGVSGVSHAPGWV